MTSGRRTSKRRSHASAVRARCVPSTSQCSYALLAALLARDRETAATLLAQGCELGDAEACELATRLR